MSSYPELWIYTTNFDGDRVMKFTTATCTVHTTPTLPAPNGNGMGKVTGYTDPNTGVVYTSPDATQVYASCNSDSSMTVNTQDTDTSTTAPASDTDTDSTGDSDTAISTPSNGY